MKIALRALLVIALVAPCVILAMPNVLATKRKTEGGKKDVEALAQLEQAAYRANGSYAGSPAFTGQTSEHCSVAVAGADFARVTCEVSDDELTFTYSIALRQGVRGEVEVSTRKIGE